MASRLKEEGYKVGTLHSNRSQNQRQQAMDDFRQMRTQILVATDLAARGIDVKNISHVVNFDVPRFPEDYVHRVGRTARAYGVGDAMLLVDPMEESFVKGIERFIQVTFPRATVPGFQYNKPPKQNSPHSFHFPPRGQGKGPGGHGPKKNFTGGHTPPPKGQTGGNGGDSHKRPTVGFAFRDRNRANSGNTFPKKFDRPFPSQRPNPNRPSGGWAGNKPPRPGGGYGNKFKRPGGGNSFGGKHKRPAPFHNKFKKDR